MNKYTINQDLVFIAATPETADEEFCRKAYDLGLVLQDVQPVYDIGEKRTWWGKRFVDANNMDQAVCYPGDYLLIFGWPLVCITGQDYRVVGPREFEALVESYGETGGNTELHKPLHGKLFCVDAGHGGNDSGAVNTALGVQEKTIALSVATMLAEDLRRLGAQVNQTRFEDDDRPTLVQRANEANSYNADAFISIHLNSAANKAAEGIETLVYGSESPAYGLAKCVQYAMVEATGFANRGVKERPELTVLKKTRMPAILCEIGFISNDKQARELSQTSTQEKIANAIAEGIADFYG